MVDEVIVDNTDVGFAASGEWQESSAVDEFKGSSLFAKTPGASATWSAVLPETGTNRIYEVFAWWTARRPRGGLYDRDSTALYQVRHADGIASIVVDQDETHGRWVSLGQFSFADGTAQVMLTASGNDRNGTSADAVRFVPLGGKA